MMRRLSLGVALCFTTALGCGDDTGSGNNNTADAGSDAGSTSSTGGSSTGTGTGTRSSSSSGTGSTASDDAGAGGDGGTFTISSPDFEDGAPLPEANTCEGQPFGGGYSPELEWSGAPASTKRYALVFKDLTIEANPGGFPQRAYHWIAWDIPTSVTGIPQHLSAGESPAELEGGKQFRGGPPQPEPEFFGPCPAWVSFVCPGVPRAEDEYAFVLYAFDDEELDYPEPVEGEPYAIALNAFLAANAIAATELNATSNAKPTTNPAPDFVCPGDAGVDGGDAAADGGETSDGGETTPDGGEVPDGGQTTPDGGESSVDDAAVDAEAPNSSDASADASGDASDAG